MGSRDLGFKGVVEAIALVFGNGSPQSVMPAFADMTRRICALNPAGQFVFRQRGQKVDRQL